MISAKQVVDAVEAELTRIVPLVEALLGDYGKEIFAGAATPRDDLIVYLRKHRAKYEAYAALQLSQRKPPAPTKSKLDAFLDTLPEKRRPLVRKTLNNLVRVGSAEMTQAEMIERAERNREGLSVAFTVKRPLNRTSFNRMDGSEQNAWELAQVEAGLIPEYGIRSGDAFSTITITKTQYDYARFLGLPLRAVGAQMNYLGEKNSRIVAKRVLAEYADLFDLAKAQGAEISRIFLVD